MIDLALLYHYAPSLLRGAVTSAGIAAGALCIGFVGGTLIALGMGSPSRFLRGLLRAYTTVIRGTPMLVQIVFVYYLLNSWVSLSPLQCAIIAIGMNSSAYVSHIIRAGIVSISVGQLEAAASLGIQRWPLLRTVILPQAIMHVLPALLNESITLVKDTSLASVIGVLELYQRGKDIITLTYDSLTVYAGLAMIYLAMTFTLSQLARLIEHYLASSYAHRNESL